MKVTDLFARYSAGERNFQRVDLSGQSLEGHNLSGADFSGANLQGTNFSNAILENTKFLGAKLGLQERSILTLLIGLYVISGIASLCVAVFVWFSSGFFIEDETTKLLGGIGFIVLTVIWLMMAINKDLVAAMVSGIISGGILGAIAGHLNYGFLGFFFGSLIVGGLTGVTEAFALVSILAIVSAIALAGEKIAIIPIIVSIIVAIPTALAFYEGSKEITLIIGPGIFIMVLTLMGIVSVWLTLKGDNRDAWIRPIIILISSWKGTSFYNANLTDSDLTETNLKGVDLKQANLMRTCFQQTKKLDFARLSTSILSDLTVRQLLVTGEGSHQSYENANLYGANLKGVTLASANLENANLRDANLDGANLNSANFKQANLNQAILRNAHLEYANLMGVQAIDTDFSQAFMTGACVDSWNINSATKLDEVDCQWIYLLEQESDLSEQYGQRHPSRGEFSPGGFAKLFQEISQTVELITWAGVDWKDFLSTANAEEVEAIATQNETPTGLILLTLDGNFEEGFSYVTAQLWLDNERFPIQIPGGLPPAPELKKLYMEWQSSYGMIIVSRPLMNRGFDKNQVTNVSIESECDTVRQFEDDFNMWLKNESFSLIQKNLEQRFNRYDNIQIIIVSEDEYIRRIPWHIWDFCTTHSKAETALSLPFYDRPEKLTPSRQHKRILVILGDSTGIDVETDKKTLEAYLQDAELVFVPEPSLEKLYTFMLDEKGWDILCFSGHSQSSQDVSQGYIKINPQEKISVESLEIPLRQMLRNGLELAIFNSCDGLGIAKQLQDLHIPQVVVMREQVPDQVAQQFFKDFIIELSQGQSLYLSVRKAREKLKVADFEKILPGISWLPVICQNPAEI